MEQQETQQQPSQDAEKKAAFEGDEVEVIEKGIQMIEALEIPDNDKQAFESGIESLLQEPDHPSLLSIDDPAKKLQLQSEYTILGSMRQHCLAALVLVEKAQKNGTVPDEFIYKVTDFLAKYQRQLTKYQNATETNNTRQ